ncbi:MAG: hypothetical protein PVS2B1_23810 [Candidatus Dormibacteraceae bacterium]
MRDVVTNLFHKLGMTGAIIIASALIFGVVAGGVIVHRLDTTPSASSEQEQGAEADDHAKEKGEKQGEKGNGHGHEKKNKNANHGHGDSSKQGNSEDK